MEAAAVDAINQLTAQTEAQAAAEEYLKLLDQMVVQAELEYQDKEIMEGSV
jgi:hypothetical protein